MLRLISLSVAVAATLLPNARAAMAEPDSPEQATLLIGVLENVATVTGVKRVPHVRVVFRHTAAGGWEAFPNDCLSQECLARISAKYPSRSTWTVSLAGLTVGTIVGRTPAAFHSEQEIGLQDITSKGPIPFVGKPSIEYAGAVGEPVLRPLLATSGGPKPRRSQAGWKEGSPDPEDLERVWPAFKRLVPMIDNCPPAEPATSDPPADSQTQAGTHDDAQVPPGRQPHKLDLEIPVAWVARNGEAFLRVAVRPGLFIECDGPRGFPSQLWFHREATGRVRALPGQLAEDRADLVAPLEFTDLLRDGHDEVLFRAAGHDRGGYVLYYDRLQKRVAHLWAYR